LAKSFEAIGWYVEKVQENLMTAEYVAEIQKQADYKFILYTRTWRDCGLIWKQVMKETKLPTVSFHLDLYLGIDRGKDLLEDQFWNSKYCFSADGGHQEEFKKLGINHYFLPPAVFKKECYLGKVVPKFQSDVIFVGSYNYHPEWDYRKLLVNWLREQYGYGFKQWGSGETIRGDELNNLYASAKVIVGDSLYSPNYWSDRLPETLGRGGFLIFPKIDGIEKHFEYYKHFIPYNYGDWDSLKEIIDYYISHDDEREAIRIAGHEWVKQNHTYINRALEIIKVLKENGEFE
jgi:hypothetical protein